VRCAWRSIVLGTRPARVALVIPDLATKVSLIKFDQVPAKRDDLDQLVRWQMRKSAPFSIEESCVTYTPGMREASGSAEFVVVLARRGVIEEYEKVCADAGVYAGLVDLSTFSVVNLFLASSGAPPR
jgi:Tfp pilus assembly PilM family ATPase